LKPVDDLIKFRRLHHKRKSGSAKTLQCPVCKTTVAPMTLIVKAVNEGWENIKESEDANEIPAIGYIKDAIRQAEALLSNDETLSAQPLTDERVLSSLRWDHRAACRA